METPQTGIFALGDAAHGFFEFSLRPDADAQAAVSALVSVREPRSTVGGANRVIGIRPSLWRKLSPNDTPQDVHDFERPIAAPADTACLRCKPTFGPGFPRQAMLEQMAGIGGPRDALTLYTEPVTGAYYFVPSVQALRRFAPPDEEDS